MGGFSDPNFADLLRRQQLLAQLQNTGPAPINGVPQQPPPDPTSTPVPANLQASTPVPQAPQMQSSPMVDPSTIKNPAEELAQYEKAAQTYGAVGPPPQMKDYKRSPILTALFALPEARAIMRSGDPVGALQRFSAAARPGYTGAMQQYEGRLQAAQMDFQAKQKVLDEANKNYAAQLNAAKTVNAMRIATDKHNMDIQEFGPKMALTYAHIAQATSAAQKNNRPTLSNEMWAVPHMVNGQQVTTNAFRITDKDGNYQWRDAATGAEIKDPTGNATPVAKSSAANSPWAALLQDKIARHQAAGETITPELHEKLLKESISDASAPVTERQQMIAQRENFNRVARQFDAKANTIAKPIDLELGSIRGLNAALSAPSANGVAQQLSIVEAATAMAGGMRPVSRYNLAEINRILTASGGINGIRATLQHWLKNESGVPVETLQQLKELSGIMEKELRFQQSTIDKYRTELNKAGVKYDYDKVADLSERLDKALAAGPPKSLEDVLKDRKLIQ